MALATRSMVGVPDSAAAADAPHTGLVLDRAGLAARAGVPAFVVDLVIDAGLLTPLDNGADGERFGADDVEMLTAARTLVGEGVAVEELAALAVRHATNVENLIDDAIDLLKRHFDREGHDEAALVASVNRLVPVATKLVVGHFEKTLWARAMARFTDDPAPAAGAIIVKARRIDRRVDPLAAYASAGAARHRSVWLRPDASLGLAAIGAVEAIEPVGCDRFSAASAARAVLAARIRRDGPHDAPAPVLVGGFSFTPTADRPDDSAPSDTGAGPGDDVGRRDGAEQGDGSGQGSSAGQGDGARRDGTGQDPATSPRWDGFGDCWLVLPELTVIDRPDGTWVLAATRVGPDGDEAAATAELERRLEDFESEPPAWSFAAAAVTAADNGDRACARDDEYLALVSSAVGAIEQSRLQKVVLARTFGVDGELDAVAVLDRLRRRNPACATFAFASGPSTFLGATPEELVVLDGSRLRTVALAGTASPGVTAPKPTSASRPGCWRRLRTAPSTASWWTESSTRCPASGSWTLRPPSLDSCASAVSSTYARRSPLVCSADAPAPATWTCCGPRCVLHPTAAVGGAPTDGALEFIAGHEGFDRGWYAAPVGWCDLDGNGELGVALRCALTGPDGTLLIAGAGVVADSDPAGELEETAMKLRALLDVLDAS